jgi:MSHA pilin protein MshA
MKKTQAGFTLIELIAVIAILGILAAFAMPRFAGLEVQARTSAVQGLEGSIRSAAALAHSVHLATGSAPGATITMEGQNVTMVNGYPTADAAGIGSALVSFNGFTQAAGAFTKDGATTPANCSVTYTAAGAGGSPTFATVVTGC